MRKTTPPISPAPTPPISPAPTGSRWLSNISTRHEVMGAPRERVGGADSDQHGSMSFHTGCAIGTSTGRSTFKMDESQTINDLLDIMHEHDLDALKVKVGERIFELVRREGGVTVMPSGAPPAPGAGAGTVAAPNTPQASANAKKVTAPLVGVFYRSPSPDAEPFVKPGDRVEPGQVLCILEAMKLFNEITSDYAGVIARIIPENGELVSMGQEMFWIEP